LANQPPLDLLGTYELLNALKLPLQIQFNQGSMPMMPLATEATFSTQFGLFVYSRLSHGCLWLTETRSGSVACLKGDCLALWTTPDVDHRFFWHTFMRMAVAAYLSDRNVTPLHAAALVDPGGALWLFAGYTHSGKSTLTIGLLESGWQYLGDDGVVLAETDVGIVAHSWWGSSLLDPILTEHYPHLIHEMGDWVGQRRAIDLRQCYPHQWLTENTPVYLAFPCFDTAEPLARLEPLSPGMALGQLMQHSAPWLLENPQPHLRRLQALCCQTQHFTLHLGSALRTQPDRVNCILSSQ
jgi:hypothetical protein